MGLAVSATGLAALSLMAGPPPARDTGQAAAPLPPSAPEAPADTAVVEQPEPQTEQQTQPADTAPPQTTDAPQATAVEVPAGSGFQTNRPDVAAALPRADDAPASGIAPQLDMLNTPAIIAPDLADRSTAAPAPADQDIALMPAPDSDATAPALRAPAPQPVPDRATPAEPAMDAPRETAPDIAARGPELADDTRQPMPDQTEPDSDMRPATGRTDVTQPAQPQAMPAPAPLPNAQRQALPRIESAPPAGIAGSDAPAAPLPPSQTTAEQSAPAFRPTIGNLATSLVDRPASDPATAPDTATATDSQTALERNAQAFTDAEDRPRLSVILMDRGDSAVSAEALGAFPYPLTFAVDSSLPDAGEISARYRAAGFEVMALVDLDPASTAQDAEVALEYALAAVPDAVAVMEGDASGFQFSKEVSDQITAILRQRGYGLVMRPNGLNTPQKLAARAGVPSATIFRDFDGAGQDAAAIRRFLDQGAFKAGQRAGEDASLIVEDGIIMLGRLRPDTISALLLWGLQDRARRVALSPVSAVLAAPAE